MVHLNIKLELKKTDMSTVVWLEIKLCHCGKEEEKKNSFKTVCFAGCAPNIYLSVMLKTALTYNGSTNKFCHRVANTATKV